MSSAHLTFPNNSTTAIFRKSCGLGDAVVNEVIGKNRDAFPGDKRPPRGKWTAPEPGAAAAGN
jgi:hypothetical protein